MSIGGDVAKIWGVLLLGMDRARCRGGVRKKEVKKRKMKKGYIAPIAILVLVLAVFSTPAMAVEWLEPLICLLYTSDAADE